MIRTIRVAAKKALEWVIAREGYALKERTAPPRGLFEYTKDLAHLGFDPKTVIDVGIGHGTPWLYEAFPLAHFELFEPLDCFVPDMALLCERYDARYHLCALGAEQRTSLIEVNHRVPTSSTMAGRFASSLLKDRQPKECKIVPTHQLDEFGPFPPPILLKLDVEGFESEVLKGASDTLTQTEVIICEVGVAQRHQREMSFGAFMSFMESLGFSLIDFPELSPLGRNGPLAYVDAAFVRSDSSFRKEWDCA